MIFLWPDLLWLLALVPLLVAGYVWLLRRRKKLAVRYANLSMVKEAMGTGRTLRRHIPAALFFAGLTIIAVALARPAALVTLPSAHGTIILAIDVSGSMRATDVEPNRLEAAQAAARSFVDDQPHGTRVGVVSFAGTAALVQPPTNNRDDILSAIDRFQLQRGTAIGSGILVSLAALFPEAGITIDSLDRANASTVQASPFDTQKPGASAKNDFKPVPPGSYTSAAIILLTDGQRTTGPDSLDAARLAADRGVRIFTVGVGTVNGETIGFGGWSMRVRLDEDTLKAIANVTRGEYFYAGNATDLKKVYQSLSSRFVMEKKQVEITAFFAAVAAALFLAAAALSLLWFNRIL